MQDILEFYTPEEAWEELLLRKTQYYDVHSAVYSGDKMRLRETADSDSYWRRNGKGKIHIPIAADIASTSADLLFSEAPRFSCFCNETEDNDSIKQKRLDYLIEQNGIQNKLAEGAESAAALGDVCLKLNWDKVNLYTPILSVSQADTSLPEYRLGILRCIHFFTVLKEDEKNKAVWRIYERYEKGKILMAVYKGDIAQLGTRQDDAVLEDLGYTSEIDAPIDEMLAVHISNMKPNRFFRNSDRGRSDFEGLRGMMDALDEAYSSWMRDIRLAKSRLIIPAEYLRRKPTDIFKEGSYTYEFDEDVETLVALDIDPDRAGAAGITPSQFNIRATEHLQTCEDLIRNIVSMAGYSPQTFGMDIKGQAQSGTALHIREKKSFNTRGKKEQYWKSPLEAILTAMIHLDAALYPGNQIEACDRVKVKFSDSLSNDFAVTASSLELLHRARKISTETAVEMLHPDWNKKQVAEEVERIKNEFGFLADSPSVEFGDFEDANDDDDHNDENGGGSGE